MYLKQETRNLQLCLKMYKNQVLSQRPSFFKLNSCMYVLSFEIILFLLQPFYSTPLLLSISSLSQPRATSEAKSRIHASTQG